MNMSRETIKNSPQWDPNRPVSRKYELRLHKYYGSPSVLDLGEMNSLNLSLRHSGFACVERPRGSTGAKCSARRVSALVDPMMSKRSFSCSTVSRAGEDYVPCPQDGDNFQGSLPRHLVAGLNRFSHQGALRVQDAHVELSAAGHG